MPSQTDVWDLPYALLGDEANIEESGEPLAERLEVIFNTLFGQGDLGFVPIGAILPYAGTVLPTGTNWDWADGGLIDKTTFDDFFARVGHAYNGGVDPGSNMVRKPDKRGRVPMGADNFGAGAAGRLPNTTAKSRGQGGGAELHAHVTVGIDHLHGSSYFTGAHAHSGGSLFTTGHSRVFAPQGGSGEAAAFANSVSGIGGGGTDAVGNIGVGGTTTGADRSLASGSDSRSSLQPYEVDHYIVRVA